MTGTQIGGYFLERIVSLQTFGFRRYHRAHALLDQIGRERCIPKTNFIDTAFEEIAIRPLTGVIEITGTGDNGRIGCKCSNFLSRHRLDQRTVYIDRSISGTLHIESEVVPVVIQIAVFAQCGGFILRSELQRTGLCEADAQRIFIEAEECGIVTLLFATEPEFDRIVVGFHCRTFCDVHQEIAVAIQPDCLVDVVEIPSLVGKRHIPTASAIVGHATHTFVHLPVAQDAGGRRLLGNKLIGQPFVDGALAIPKHKLLDATIGTATYTQTAVAGIGNHLLGGKQMCGRGIISHSGIQQVLIVVHLIAQREISPPVQRHHLR